ARCEVPRPLRRARRFAPMLGISLIDEPAQRRVGDPLQDQCPELTCELPRIVVELAGRAMRLEQLAHKPRTIAWQGRGPQGSPGESPRRRTQNPRPNGRQK